MRWAATVVGSGLALGAACTSSHPPSDGSPPSVPEGGGGNDVGGQAGAFATAPSGEGGAAQGGQARGESTNLGEGGVAVDTGTAGAATGDGGDGGDGGEAGHDAATNDVPAASCGPTTCAPGETRCAGNGVQTCGAELVWGKVAPCPDATPVCSAGSCSAAPSCAGLAANCGSTKADNCCYSSLVSGGSFNRFDRGNATAYPATVSSFRLDRYEATVGRFRQFVAAAVNGWLPAAGSGKHSHIGCGSGLNESGGAFVPPAGYEPGWDPKWNDTLPVDKSDWDYRLTCAPYPDWTPEPGGNERLPVNCVNWTMAAAFCIWDGGFLPSDTEWSYAAAGGAEQRTYPWGNTEPAIDAKLAVWHCAFMGNGNYCLGIQNIAPVGSVPAGKGRYGQLDLAGNLPEWTLDWWSSLTAACNDCAYATARSKYTTARGLRGGGYDSLDSAYATLSSVDRYSGPPAYPDGGVRCARSP